MQHEKRNMAVSSLIADNAFTVKALYRLGFAWPVVSENCIQRSIRALLRLGFFDRRRHGPGPGHRQTGGRRQ